MAARFSVIALLPAGTETLAPWLTSFDPSTIEVIGLVPGEDGIGAALNEGLQRASGEFASCLLADAIVMDLALLERLAQAVIRGPFDLVGPSGGANLSASPREWFTATAQAALVLAPQPAVWLDPRLIFARRATLLRWRFEENWPADTGPLTVLDLTLRLLLWGCQRVGTLGLPLPPLPPSSAADAVENQILLRHGGCLPLTLPGVARWQANLRVLRLVAPQVAATLTAERKSGRTTTFTSTSDAIVPNDRASVALRDAPANYALGSGDTLVLLGAGNGAPVNAALASPASRILVLEPDAHLLSHLLTRESWDTPLCARRLIFHVIPADLHTLKQLAMREYVAVMVSILRRGGTVHVSSSSSAQRYPELSNVIMDALKQAVRDAQELPALMTAARPSYDVTVISPRCALFNDIARTFEAAGLRTRLLQVPDLPLEWSRDERRAVFARLRADPGKLILVRNRVFFETDTPDEPPGREIYVPAPVVSWWWDVPNVATTVDLRAQLSGCRHYAFARDLLTLLPEGAQWLPPAARPQFCETAPTQSEPDIDVSFVGQSRLSLLQTNLDELVSLLDYFAGGTGRRIARDISRRRGFVAIHDYLSTHVSDIDALINRIEPGAPTAAYYLSYILAMSITGAFRIAAIEKLRVAGIPVTVYGDDDWLRSGAVDSTQFRGILPVEKLPALYRRSRVNLNLNFMQVSSTVNPKVLDIAACGAVALTDNRPELEALYPDPGARPFSFHGLDDLIERIADLRTMDLSIHREAVRSQTLAHHTLSHRVNWIARQFGLLPAVS